MKIFTFGDSHCYNGWNQIPFEVKCVHLGPRLMFTFGNYRLKLLDISKSGIVKGNLAVFCFGEIDVRCHVYKYRDRGPEQVIEGLVANYREAIRENVQKVPGVKVGVYFVPPPVYKEKLYSNPNTKFPYLGTNEERRQYAILMNKALKAMSQANRFIFFDLYRFYEDENGLLDRQKSDDGPHIKDTGPLQAFLNGIIGGNS